MKKKVSKRKGNDGFVYGEPKSIGELIRSAENEDLTDAWDKLLSFEETLGEQRIYTSEKAIMFARRICHAFVRPKKAYLELCFFLDHPLDSSDVKVQERSSKKYGHTIRVVHADQIEEPLTDWLKEAYELGV